MDENFLENLDTSEYEKFKIDNIVGFLFDLFLSTSNFFDILDNIQFFEAGAGKSRKYLLKPYKFINTGGDTFEDEPLPLEELLKDTETFSITPASWIFESDHSSLKKWYSFYEKTLTLIINSFTETFIYDLYQKDELNRNHLNQALTFNDQNLSNYHISLTYFHKKHRGIVNDYISFNLNDNDFSVLDGIILSEKMNFIKSILHKNLEYSNLDYYFDKNIFINIPSLRIFTEISDKDNLSSINLKNMSKHIHDMNLKQYFYNLNNSTLSLIHMDLYYFLSLFIFLINIYRI